MNKQALYAYLNEATLPASGKILDPAGTGHIFAWGATVPTDATAGYLPGCLFIHTDGIEDTALYVNDGSVTSCDFNTVPSNVSATSTELSLLSGLLATAAELNRAADMSTKVVNTTATTLSITATQHGSKVVTVSSTAPIAITLPAATGSGEKYTFVVAVVATATAHTIAVANTADVITGVCNAQATSTNEVAGFATTATDDTITLNGTTTGGSVGDIIEIIDIASGTFWVNMRARLTGTIATPFSAAV